MPIDPPLRGPVEVEPCRSTRRLGVRPRGDGREPRVKLGLALPHYDYSFPGPGPVTFQRVAGYAERAEAAGFSELWVSDHFWSDLERYGGPPGRQGTLECWTTLAALAVRTRAVRLGSLVLAVGFRPPTLLAKMAATLDQLAGGRGDRLLGVVARAADGWNVVWAIAPEEYDQRLEVLAAACARVGRPLAEVRRSVGLATLIGRDPDDLAARWRRLQAWAPGGALDGVDLGRWASTRLVGTADQVLGQLRGWRERGVEQVICSFSNLPFAVFEDEQLDLLAELVLPRLA